MNTDQLIQSLQQLCRENEELKVELEQRDRTIALLKRQLDLEHRYLLDTKARSFPSFLRRQPASPLIQRLLAHPLLPARASHWTYDNYCRCYHLCSEDELSQVKDLWKAMLLEDVEEIAQTTR